MSTQEKWENEIEEKPLETSNSELIRNQDGPLESETFCLKSSSPDCKKKNFKDSSCSHTEQTVVHSTENGYLLIGEHENQVSEFGAEDLPNLKKKCTKNPGHPEFIPIDSFSLNHLPVGYRDMDLYEFVKAAADLTVRIDVRMTSLARPEFWPETTIPYFLSGMRGTKTLRTGSGMVREVWTYPKDNDDEVDGDTSCPCVTCEASDQRSNVWWKLVVNTAAHVVFDDIEASHTTLRLFYDSEDSDVVILKDKVRVEDESIEEDWCELSCVTCDGNLGAKLEEMQRRFEDVWVRVQDKYKESRDVHKLNFIVSHPHGCSKQVSVGHWNEKVQVGDEVNVNKFTYTTCTCPGSSGAYIHCVGYSGWSDYAHSGSLMPGLNVSASNYVWPGEDSDAQMP